MLHIVQVYPYMTHNGCSVRVGKGNNVSERLTPIQCHFFDFVEIVDEVENAIKYIEKLPSCYRQIDDSIYKLKQYLKIAILREANFTQKTNESQIALSDEIKRQSNLI